MCRARLGVPNSRFFAGPPADAIQELIALTDPFLSSQIVPTEGDDDGPVGSEWDHWPILRLTKFCIYDELDSHFCSFVGGEIEANHFLFASGS